MPRLPSPLAARRRLAWIPLVLAVLLEGTALADQTDPRLGALFRALADAPSTPQAARVEAEIWSVWLECDQQDARESLARGLRALDAGDVRTALRAFDEVVGRAPDFAEGWNKRATAHYLMGAFDASLRDIERTLALEPRHFGALSGLALIRAAQGRPFEALEALEQVARLYPRLPHLQERVDQLTRELGEPI